MPYYSVSAKTGESIEELFYKIAEMLDKQEREKHKKMKAVYNLEYEHPPSTVESLTRSQTKSSTLDVKEEDDKEKLIEKKSWTCCPCLRFLES